MQKSNTQSSCRVVRRNVKPIELRARILSLLVIITVLLIAASSDASVHTTKTPAHDQHIEKMR